MEPTNQVTGLYSGYTHTIKENINCQDKNVIYYWKCVKDNCPDYPKCEYIGLSSRRFQDRLCEHRDYAKSVNLEQPAGKHFTANAHSVADLKGCCLEKVKSRDKFVLRETHTHPNCHPPTASNLASLPLVAYNHSHNNNTLSKICKF